MTSKNICFCIRIGTQKSRENELGDAEKLSEQKTSDHHHKSRKKGKSRGHASATPVDDSVGGVPGVTTTGGTAGAAGVTTAVVSAVHVSATSADEGGSSHGHGGDSGGCDGGG